MPARRRERMLATVLFTDIVGSTDLAAELGDRRWRELLARHHMIVRGHLKRFGGREVDTAGDGFFATFDGQTDALRCACAISDAVHELGIDIRAGVHVGEAELMGKKIGGIAVHTGARIVSVAGPGEVLVSGVVRDLVPGSGIDFADHGVHQLKGVPGEWRLFTVTRVDGEVRRGPLEKGEAERLREAIQPRPLMQRRGGRVALAAIAALAVVAGVVLALTRDGEEPAPRPAQVRLDSVVQLDPDSGEVLMSVPIGSVPVHVAAGEGGAWVISNRFPGQFKELHFIDPDTGESTSVGSGGTDVALGSGWVWMAEGGGTGPQPAAIGLLRIDPATFEVDMRISIGIGGDGRVVAEGNTVWVTNDGHVITRVNGVTGRVEGETRIDGNANSLAVGEGAAWVGDELNSVVWRIDPAGEVEAMISIPGNLDAIAAGEGGIWVLDSSAGTVIRIDPEDNTPGRAIRVGTHPTDLAAGLGAVWVANYEDGTVSRIDRLSQRVRTIDVGRPVVYLAVDEEQGRLWLSVPSCLPAASVLVCAT